MTFKAVLSLCRASNLPTVWMNVLTAALLTNVASPWDQIAALALALSCFYCAGMAMNDLCDLAHDRIHQPYRPIVAGRLTRRQAISIMTLLFLCGFVLLALAGSRLGFASGIGLCAVIWVYNRYHKQFPITVFVMAGARLMVYVVTALCLSEHVLPAVWLAALVQTAYVTTLTAIARAEHKAPTGRYSWPVVPWLIAIMPMIDAAVLMWLVSPMWSIAGVLALWATRFGQKYIRGD
jgi:4-hydroxybenzoate polyprenyltransferase